jgi:N utilization substance protein B
VGRRRRAREHALQILFQIDLTGGNAEEVLESFWGELDAGDDVREFTARLVRGTLNDREQIDRRVAEAAENWRLERMPTVDRNVLRMAVYELVCADSPPPVVIDEAIEVARRFGGEESAGFVNGVLDRIRGRLDAERHPAGEDGG